MHPKLLWQLNSPIFDDNLGEIKMPIMNSFEQRQILAHTDFFFDKGYSEINEEGLKK